MKRGMTIEYLKCRKNFNFEVDFGVNDVIGMIVTECKSCKDQRVGKNVNRHVKPYY